MIIMRWKKEQTHHISSRLIFVGTSGAPQTTIGASQYWCSE